MSEIISLINLKGGVGKTISCINIAYSMAELGKKVLIVDTDAQGNIATSLGVDADLLEITLFDLLNEVMDTYSSNPESVRKCIISIGKVDILPSNSKLADLTYKHMNAQCRETILREILETIAPEYDYIIIDCPPSLGLIVTNALTASTEVLIPVEAQYLSFESLKVMLTFVTSSIPFCKNTTYIFLLAVDLPFSTVYRLPMVMLYANISSCVINSTKESISEASHQQEA